METTTFSFVREECKPVGSTLCFPDVHGRSARPFKPFRPFMSRVEQKSADWKSEATRLQTFVLIVVLIVSWFKTSRLFYLHTGTRYIIIYIYIYIFSDCFRPTHERRKRDSWMLKRRLFRHRVYTPNLQKQNTNPGNPRMLKRGKNNAVTTNKKI